MVLKQKSKIIVILGPTASGKTDLSIEIAKKFNGEVISADSRQVYRGMDIGTGKITKQEMQGIKHYLLDVASPKRKFTIAQFQKKAHKAIKAILKKNKLPIVCGGSAFYIQSIVDNIMIPKVKPDWKLRKQLQKQTAEELFKKLKALDPKRARNIDKHNKRRLIRAIEINKKTKQPIPKLKQQYPYNTLIIGIKKDKQGLKKNIQERLKKRLKQGMIEEVKKLHKSGVSYKRLEELGLEYKNISLYLQNKISKQDMIQNLQREIEQFSKRQMTWFKKDKRITWIKNKKTASELIKKFLGEIR